MKYSAKSSVKQILTMALPIIIQGVVFQLQSLTDKAFLGHLDSKLISALGSAQFPFYTTMDALVGIGTGVTIIIAQLYGAKRYNEMSSYVKSTAFFGTLFAGVLFAMWYFFPRPLIALLGVDELLIGYCVDYVRICSWYFLIIALDGTLQNYLTAIGNTRPIMYAGILKVVLNILFSWILIFGKLGFPQMGVAGAAWGTLLSNIVSFLFLVVYCFIIKRNEYRLHEDNSLWFRFKPFAKGVKLGFPTGAEYLLWNASNLYLIRLLNLFSYDSMTIYTLTFSIEIIVFAVFSGTSRAAMTIMGQNIGAKDMKKANFTSNVCIVLNLILVSIGMAVFCLFPRPILGIFTSDARIILMSAPFLVYAGITMIPKSMNVVIGGSIRAYGDTRWMLYSQIFGSVLVVALSWYLVYMLKLDMTAIYITLFADETARSLINYAHYRRKFVKPASQVKNLVEL